MEENKLKFGLSFAHSLVHPKHEICIVKRFSQTTHYFGPLPSQMVRCTITTGPEAYIKLKTEIKISWAK